LLTHSSGHDRKSLLDWFGQFRENGIQARDFGLPLSYRRDKGHSRDPILDCVYETLERLAGLFACCLRLRKQPGSLIESALQFSRQAVGDVSQCSWPEEFGFKPVSRCASATLARMVSRFEQASTPLRQDLKQPYRGLP
jgi:hypothetical protein